VTTLKARGEGEEEAEEEEATARELPFLYLTVDVPPAPLFKDALERNIIPQVPLYLPISPHISPYLPISPRRCRCLRASQSLTARRRRR